MIETILGILRNDESLMSLIDCIDPNGTENADGNSIVYSLTPLTDDRIKRTDRLEIRIIAKSVKRMFSIDTIVRKLLLTLGDEPLRTGIQKVEINGGGQMEDLNTATYHLLAYYIITSRSDL